MNATAFAFAGYITWFLVLLGGIAVYRSALTVSGKREANSFKPHGEDVSDFSGRLCRAHANCYESFPIVGGLLILALVTNSTEITNSLALIVLACRVAQSTIHLFSTSAVAVQARFAFFLAQYVICFYWSI
ncbi:MAG: MAPEG family protein, partial [Deltaproteobacteria bacterium]|nr:MAPEG family protein [Deltaproteobacteria bacterium]